MESDEPVPVVTIVRDHNIHRWVLAESGAHPIKTPWVDDAPADQVVRWLRLNANGRIDIRVDLR